MKARSAWFLILGLASIAPSATLADIPSYCSLPDIHRVSVPVYPERADSPRFDFAFQWVEKGGPDAPTIVYFPGGPGGSAISDWSNPLTAGRWDSHGFPRSGANVLFLDPRGVGCNDLDAAVLPDESLSTANIVSDALAAIRNLKIKRYAVYGISYGTMPATELAYRAERGEAQAGPIAVLLGGVIGKAWPGNPILNIASQQARQWELFKKTLPVKAVERMTSESPLLGLEDDTWNWFISKNLTSRYVWENGQRVFALQRLADLARMDPASDAALVALIKEQTQPRDPSAPPRPYSDRLYRVVDCSEISDNDPQETRYSKGVIEAVPASDPCVKGVLPRPYDPAAYPVRAPIVYVQGTSDAEAPIEGALEHFQAQTRSSARYFIRHIDGGHLGYGAVFPDCAPALWSSFLAGAKDLPSALSGCHAPVELEVATAAQPEPRRARIPRDSLALPFLRLAPPDSPVDLRTPGR